MTIKDKIAKGNSNQILRSDGSGAPQWVDANPLLGASEYYAQGDQLDSLAALHGLKRHLMSFDNGKLETDAQLRDRILDYLRDIYSPINVKYSLPAPECAHSWKHYEGLMNSFDYCEKCDQKKS